MTLQRAIELVQKLADEGVYTTKEVLYGEFSANLAEAIATILNAVVKGELK